MAQISETLVKLPKKKEGEKMSVSRYIIYTFIYKYLSPQRPSVNHSVPFSPKYICITRIPPI